MPSDEAHIMLGLMTMASPHYPAPAATSTDIFMYTTEAGRRYYRSTIIVGKIWHDSISRPLAPTKHTVRVTVLVSRGLSRPPSCR